MCVGLPNKRCCFVAMVKGRKGLGSSGSDDGEVGQGASIEARASFLVARLYYCSRRFWYVVGVEGTYESISGAEG